MEKFEFTGKSVEEALANASATLNVPASELTYTVLEEASSGFLGIFNSKPAKIEVSVNSNTDVNVEDKNEVKTAQSDKTIEEVVKKFLSDIFAAMDMVVDIAVTVDEADETVIVDLSGDNMGVLIGKRGQTLDSLQYLVRLVVNKKSDKYLRVKLDTENYRERRKETLENLAKNIAFKVKRTKRSVSLEPMNPYERRVIHSALQNDKYVTTKSEGEEPFRHVVVMLKR